MRLFYKALLAAAIMLAAGNNLYAQLTGTITIPSASYPTLASAVTALNTLGVGTGGVIINLQSGNPQTAPAGGYLLGSAVLNVSTSSTNTITINGNNNTVTANVGTSTTTDGIFVIQGVDNLTINTLNLSESAANTTATTQMEWGYALVKRNATAPFDGCQNVTIQNCTITLNRTNIASAGIYANNHIATSLTQLTITAATDANSNNKFYGNTIQNSYTGISVIGSSATTFSDQNNDIGGTTAATGNTIQNYGGGTTSQVGIVANYQNGANISRNTINNAGGGGVAGGSAQLAGIIYTSTGTVTVLNNTITLQQGTTSNAGAVAGISDNTASTPVSTTISGNTISGSGGGTGAWNGIELLGSNPTINITADTFRNINIATTAAAHLIHIGASALGNTINVTGSTLTGTTTPYFTKTGGGNNFAFYYNVVANSNSIANISGNNITQVSLTGATTFYGIYAFDVSGTGKKNVYNNTVSNITGGTSAMYGVVGGNADSTKLYGNTVTGVSGGGIIYCLNIMGNANTSVYKNKVTSVNGVSTNATVYGVYCNGGNVNVYNNFFTDLTAPATSSNTGVNGIYGAAGNINAHDNTIVLGKTTAITGGANFSCAGVYSSSPLVLKNNIIYVNATPTGTGIAACIKRNTVANTAGNPPTASAFTANNNIYYINTGTQNYIYEENITVATVKNGYAISGLTANTTTNIVNDPSFNKPCSAYKNFMSANGESNSYYENNITSLGSGLYAPVGSSYAESGAAALVTDDYLGTTRSNPPDIGGLEFSGTIPTSANPTIVYTALPDTTICVSPVLSATINGVGTNTINTTTAVPRLYYKKTTENNVFGTYPADNTSAFNGWKYVAATGTGPNFSFTIDYTKLYSTIAVNDTIQYFVVAEDNAAIPNATISVGAFTNVYCLTGVNITTAAGGIAAIPATNRYIIKAVPAFSISGPDTVCRSSVHQISVSSTAGNFNSYTWTPTTNLYMDAATTIPYTGGNTTTVYVKKVTNGTTIYTAIASNGTAQCIATAKDTVTVVPIDTTITGNLSFCAGDSTTLSAVNNTGYTYQWKLNGNPIPGAGSPTYTVHNAGDYSISIVDNHGCSESSTAHTIIEHPAPVPTITFTGGSLGTTTFATYEWDRNGTVISGATSQTFTPTLSGDYTVTVTDANGCKGTSAVYSFFAEAVALLGHHPGITISPNPAHNVLQIKSAIPVTIIICSMDGKIQLSASGQQHVNISGLANGMYMIRILDKTGRLIGVEKMIKSE